MQHIMIWIGLTAANYFYQWLNNGNWSSAEERSFFQGSAILAIYIATKFAPSPTREQIGGAKP